MTDLALATATFIASVLASVFFCGWWGASVRAARIERDRDDLRRQLASEKAGVIMFPRRDVH
jgi:hypothetical protein